MPTESRNNRPSAHEIAALLSQHAEELAAYLTGEAATSRNRVECRFRRRGSLSVVTAGPDRGAFFDHETGVGGDALTLITHLRRESLAEAMRFAKAWLRIADQASLPRRPPAEKPKPAPAESMASLARSIWAESILAAGSPAERYLGSRGLTLPPDAPLRFHPACPRGSERLPAMVALMSVPATNEPCGIHRTFLRPDGGGQAAGTAKMMLGAAGIVRLVPDDEITFGIGIAEGIETALSVMAAGWRPVWAAGNAGAIAKFAILAGVEALTIFADHDESGAGTKAARTCAARWLAAGREVTVHTPRTAGLDWNDVLNGAV